MSTSPFDFINKSKFGSKELEGYAYFPVLTMLSSSRKFLPICQLMNSLAFSRLPEETKAFLTNEFLRTYRKEFLQYPKGAKKVVDKNNIDYQVIVQTIKCSIREAKLYVERGYITEKEIKKMKEMLI